MSKFDDYLKEYSMNQEEKERGRLENYLINKYGNYVIRREEIDKYKKKYKNLKVRECKPKDKRLVVIEIKKKEGKKYE